MIPVADPQNFERVHAAIEAAFSAAGVKDFLKSMQRAGCASGTFELVLGKGILGRACGCEYNRLGNGDQGLIREFYLASLEQVAPELRVQFCKLYAYYD